MNYILKNDHTFIKAKDVSERLIKDATCVLFDISTDRKGPLFTIVRDVNFNFASDYIDIVMDTSYAPLDLPFDDNVVIPSRYKISNLNNYYNVYPLIKQMLSFNTFRELESAIDNQILIQTIQIGYNKKIIEISEDSLDSTIRKVFKKLKMITCVKETLSNRFLILKDNTWQIYPYAKYNPNEMTFDKIGILIDNSESFYLMSYKEYHLFNSIKSLELEYQYIIENHFPVFEEFDDLYQNEFTNVLSINSFDEFLEMCVYIPQMILMERVIYKYEINLKLNIETRNDYKSLVITHDEMTNPKNLCLYYIIKKLLKI